MSAYVYYCSGHGYGHATRVSAFASQLLSLPEQDRPVVHIVSSAPKHVFADSVALGAQYRYADWIDPVIVQPLAYRVDRQKSVEVLKAFLKNKDTFLETEREWLVSVKARCVLSDAAFLGCLAAKAAGVPSILITNFTFDSVYSYLSTNFIDEQHSIQPDDTPSLAPDVPIPYSVLEPLVSQIHAGYRCADLLLLLPGHIPIPSFANQLSLPTTDWVDLQENRFSPKVIDHLLRLKTRPDECVLLDHIPFPSDTSLSRKSIRRQILPMPLLVRPSSSSIERSPYTPEGRSRLLESANVPSELHDPETTKILVVSFGGQVLKWPGNRRKPSTMLLTEEKPAYSKTRSLPKTSFLSSLTIPQPSTISSLHPQQIAELEDHRDIDPQPPQSPRLATASHIWIPGAPSPVLNPLGSPVVSSPRLFNRSCTSSQIQRTYTHQGDKPGSLEKENEHFGVTFSSPSRLNSDGAMFTPLMDLMNIGDSPRSSFISPRCRETTDERESAIEEHMNPRLRDMYLGIDEHYEAQPDETHDSDPPQKLLPNSTWIAIVCGASDSQRQDTSSLPPNFYLAPKDVYMPDLTSIADVLLGKLGYGTVAECIDAGTPMVYVSRPLFVEELGLRVLLEDEGVGVEMSRREYESGFWSERVEEAWERGKIIAKKKGREGRREVGAGGREAESTKMAGVVVDWVEDCWKGI